MARWPRRAATRRAKRSARGSTGPSRVSCRTLPRVISRRNDPALVPLLLLVAAATAASACGGPLEPALGAAPQAVVGGAPDPSSTAVGAIVYASPLCGEPNEA